MSLVIVLTGLLSLGKGADVYGPLTEGARSGLKTLGRILPSLIVMLPVLYMLRASGAIEALTRLLAPALRWLGIPPETAGLALLRPFSGSGALALGSEVMERCGPDSPEGRTAAVMLGSTETTFYVLGLYLGAQGTKKAPHALGAALIADLTAFLTASWCVKLFF